MYTRTIEFDIALRRNRKETSGCLFQKADVYVLHFLQFLSNFSIIVSFDIIALHHKISPPMLDVIINLVDMKGMN
ncbi:hypothetical protein BCV72DRAFT_228562 [Rhizopus microsporus var. microsporus]|uniref:Uncharacterized protein n=2 Tax=Rhizopus microsporus TaxID=58291 RepID=A0A2G4SM65_RHIZD|nr:uncharacterized protein RHIMIDRAFT_261007 [Rhizopus microsporus ATCC 52813]ORE06244.1 hypothetical protein BCV72DRAFT_228562 [Rhizopus microsporus var. microsporus]PHZ09861.1 hypothetical protein RHIMIDRAFT_261007 [Rhizopus microsporus ATCC 52813]